jgi:hypothetical protein
MESQSRHSMSSTAEPWIALALCIAVAAAEVLEPLVRDPSAYAGNAPIWIPLAAAVLAAVGIVRQGASPWWLRMQRASRWTALLLMVCAANGLPFDLLTMTGTMGRRTATGAVVLATVDWLGLATRTLALAAAVVLARLALARPAGSAPRRAAAWYGYAACVFALPYPVLRMHWALGGTLGIMTPGAAGHGFAPLLLATPFLIAAVLSLLLVSPRRWKPRWLLLAAGWSATTILAMIGPAAVWSLMTGIGRGGARASYGGLAPWIPGLFYGSWLLLAITEGAATRSYQLRSAGSSDVLAGL